MYVQVIKSIDDDRDMIELVEDLNHYGVDISVKTSSILNKFSKNGTLIINDKIDGNVKINLTVNDARSLVSELNRAIELAGKASEKKG